MKKILEADIYNSRILIVDDEIQNIELLKAVLTQAGYHRIFVCTRPELVCEQHQKAAFDLILLDLQMPIMDGFQVIESLQSSSRDNYLPVIVLTAQPAHKLRALQSGAKDFISKPFDLAEVKARIYNMLEVRQLYKQLERHSTQLEQTVLLRTEELRMSEERYRRLTELASDWYWEQDSQGHFTRYKGPFMEILGLTDEQFPSEDLPLTGWVQSERDTLHAMVELHQPFIDYVFHRIDEQGIKHAYQASGEPMFNRACEYQGYRGIGIEIRIPAQ